MQARGDLDLAEKPGGAHLGELGAEHLDRHRALVLEVVGEEDLGHPALSELRMEPVPGGERCAEALEALRH